MPGDDSAGRSAHEGHETVGLVGLLASRGRRARFAAVPGAAVSGGRGIRWPHAEQRDRAWWPQGIDLRRDASALVLVVSWHHVVAGADTAARVTFVDLRDARCPRFHHVLLVEAVEGALRPIGIHAGGLAWDGDRLYVADTFGGLRVFDVREILRVEGDRKPWLGTRHLLPQSGAYVAVAREGERRMRYSFVSLEHHSAGPRLVAGEYRMGSQDARLLVVPIEPTSASEPELHTPGLEHMQGVCVVDGTWYVTASRGARPGDLWTGHPGALVHRVGILPPGPEDLAHEPGTRRLWSVTERPGQRWIYSIDLDELGTVSPAG